MHPHGKTIPVLEPISAFMPGGNLVEMERNSQNKIREKSPFVCIASSDLITSSKMQQDSSFISTDN
jgi:hypothetical protein